MKSCLTSHLEVTKNLFSTSIPQRSRKATPIVEHRFHGGYGVEQWLWDKLSHVAKAPYGSRDFESSRKLAQSPKNEGVAWNKLWVWCEGENRKSKMRKIASTTRTVRTVAHFYKLLTHEKFKDKQNIGMNIWIELRRVEAGWAWYKFS